MTSYVAFLRAVNVGGRNPLPMAKVRDALTAEGLEQVSTVLQSGNMRRALAVERGRTDRSDRSIWWSLNHTAPPETPPRGTPQ